MVQWTHPKRLLSSETSWVSSCSASSFLLQTICNLLQKTFLLSKKNAYVPPLCYVVLLSSKETFFFSSGSSKIKIPLHSLLVPSFLALNSQKTSSAPKLPHVSIPLNPPTHSFSVQLSPTLLSFDQNISS